MDRYALAREFEMLRLIDTLQKTDDMEGLRKCAIGLVRLNRSLRESLAVLAVEEIPAFVPPID